MKKVYVLLAVVLIMFITGCDKGSRDSDLFPPSASEGKSITAFSLNDVAGAINETEKTIAITMPYGTDATTMVATFTITGVSVKVGSTDQVSGKTANDFTHPVTYAVTAADASTQDYTVTVTVATPSSPKSITAFSLNGSIGKINETKKTISVTVPTGTSVTNLVATFTITGAGLKVGSTDQVSGKTANDFTHPVTYTVTAADASTQDYTVTVIVASSATYSISGKVTGAVLSGVKITLSGDDSASTTTDSSGNYSFDNVANGSYTITPSLSGFAFTPGNVNITISNKNITGQNFTAKFDYTGSYTGNISIGTFSGSAHIVIIGYTETSLSATLSLGAWEWSLSTGHIIGNRLHAEGSSGTSSLNVVADGTFSSDGLTLSGTCSTSDGNSGTFNVTKE